jgi:hypothetical protein
MMVKRLNETHTSVSNQVLLYIYYESFNCVYLKINSRPGLLYLLCNAGNFGKRDFKLPP